MATRYLLLWLQAPLQSWGHDSKFGRRDTLNFPTKSGIMGLVCCALGAGGEQTELLAEFAPLKQTIISFVRSRKNTHDELIKLDREPLLRDFHMVGSGYDLDDPWQALLEPYKSDGKRRTSDGGGAKLTYRYYLQDAYFAVILEVPSEKGDSYATALQTPVWDLYLGRKSCVPTDFIYRGIFDTDDLAIEQANKIADDKKLVADFRVVDGEPENTASDTFKTEILTLMDVPVCFGERKVYRDRRVTVITA